MYYPSSENKGADQLRGFREADLRLCFRLCKLLVFSRGGSYFRNFVGFFFQLISKYFIYDGYLFLLQVAELSFSYSVAHERDSGVEKWSSEDDMEPFRTVIVLPADKLQVVIDKIKQELATSGT